MENELDKTIWHLNHEASQRDKEQAMRNGVHDHWCNKGKHPFICPKITHCDDQLATLCPDHREGLVTGWTDEYYLETGKRPGE